MWLDHIISSCSNNLVFLIQVLHNPLQVFEKKASIFGFTIDSNITKIEMSNIILPKRPWNLHNISCVPVLKNTRLSALFSAEYESQLEYLKNLKETTLGCWILI